MLATFTADATTQDIRVVNVSAVSGKDLNAYVLRAVPEPRAVAVIGLGALTLAGRRRRSA
ncbi:MAG: PEP-CTERM sorting domain-containing protein [Phycisphaerae bacterium]